MAIIRAGIRHRERYMQLCKKRLDDIEEIWKGEEKMVRHKKKAMYIFAKNYREIYVSLQKKKKQFDKC